MLGFGAQELVIIGAVVIVAIALVRGRAQSKTRTTGSVEQRSDAIVRLVVGAAIGLWVVTRMTSFQGNLVSWSPPFTEYEGVTLIGAGLAALLIILGVRGLPTNTAAPGSPSERDQSSPTTGGASSFCRHCGDSLRETDVYCGRCGKSRTA